MDEFGANGLRGSSRAGRNLGTSPTQRNLRILPHSQSSQEVLMRVQGMEARKTTVPLTLNARVAEYHLSYEG